MTSVRLATYPDFSEAGAIMAGIPLRLRDVADLDRLLVHVGQGQDARLPPGRALAAQGERREPAPRRDWQGDADYTVRPKNMTELVEQWTDVNGISDKATTSTPVGKATHDEYKDASGVLRVESWSIKGMSHGVAIDPMRGCGGTAAAYVLDEGLCSTTKAAAFFGLVTGDGSPAAGGTTSGGSAATSSGSSGKGTAGSDCDP